MAEIKIEETHMERRIKIKWQSFVALLITCVIWLHLD